MKRTLFFFVLALSTPLALNAQPLDCPESLCGAHVSDDPVMALSDSQLIRAHEAQTRGDHAEAGASYLRASAGMSSASGQRYIRLRAASAFLDASKPYLASAVLHDAVDFQLPGAGVVATRIELELGDPSRELIKAALRGPDRADVCAVAFSEGPAPFPGLWHAHCSEPDEGGVVSTGTLSFEDRMQRAWRLYGEVRFTAGFAELQAVDTTDLDEAQWCEHSFLKARTTFRLRRRNEAARIYESVAKRCSDEDIVVRSLYAWGKRRFDTGRLGESRKAFQTLVDRFSHRTHADDGWLYLARIGRQTNDAELVENALTTVLRDHRDGDMFFEIVWEYLEPTYRDKNFEGFLERLEELDLPDHDPNYFSQGRLEYFAGQAASNFGDAERTTRYLTAAWRLYPFSFYGYLARLQLDAQGVDTAALLTIPSPGGAPEWMRRKPGHPLSRDTIRLLRLGLVELAADVSRGSAQEPIAEQDQVQLRWIRAYVNHLAERFDYSHNVVRRSIEGRPWVDADDSGHIQWQLAWPAPFLEGVEEAARAEAEQAGDALVEPALAMAIMREESSFIEDIESFAGALGLMQLMPRTALAHDDDIEGDATPERLKTSEVNIRVGMDHLFWLAKRFDGHPALMTAAYNAGSGAVGKWLRRMPADDIAIFIEDIPYLQTRNYTKRVIGSYGAYQWLSGRADFDSRVSGPAR